MKSLFAIYLAKVILGFENTMSTRIRKTSMKSEAQTAPLVFIGKQARDDDAIELNWKKERANFYLQNVIKLTSKSEIKHK